MNQIAKKACVIGWPIQHSRSPLIHGYWLKKHAIAGTYDKRPVDPKDLAAFLNSIRAGELTGCNVTMPHKEQAARLVDEPDDRVIRTGSANTLYMADGKLHATSTDGPGFLANVRATIADYASATGPVVLLGAGGSASAITDELLRDGAERITICNRTLEKAEALAHRFGKHVAADDLSRLASHFANAALVINTTPAGLNAGTSLDLPLDKLPERAIVADIVYTPLVTPLLKIASAAGHRIVTGLGMLLHQAVPGFEKWFGVRPEVTQELHDLVARDIDPDYKP